MTVSRGRIALSTSQLIEAIDETEGIRLTPQTLSTWAQREIAVPSVRWPRKRGRAHARFYSLADLKRIRLIVRLRESGVSMQRVRAILDYIDAYYPQVFSRRTKLELRLVGYRVEIVSPRSAVEAPSGQVTLRFAEIMEGTRAAAETAKQIA